MNNIELGSEIITYCCQDCGGDKWSMYIEHTIDGETLLITVCGNSECVKRKRNEFNVGEDTVVIWDEFNITGQGHDVSEIPQEINNLLN